MNTNQVHKTINKLKAQRDEALDKLARFNAGDLVPAADSLRLTVEAESKLANAEKLLVRGEVAMRALKEQTDSTLFDARQAVIKEGMARDALRSELAESEAKVVALRAEVARLVDLLGDPDTKKLRRRINEKTEEVTKLRAEMVGMINRVNEVSEKLVRARDSNKSLLSEVDEMTSKLNRLAGGAALAEVLPPTKKEAQFIEGMTKGQVTT
jgi:chromosome segregation ATPase